MLASLPNSPEHASSPVEVSSLASSPLVEFTRQSLICCDILAPHYWPPNALKFNRRPDGLCAVSCHGWAADGVPSATTGRLDRKDTVMHLMDNESGTERVRLPPRRD